MYDIIHDMNYLNSEMHMFAFVRMRSVVTTSLLGKGDI